MDEAALNAAKDEALSADSELEAGETEAVEEVEEGKTIPEVEEELIKEDEEDFSDIEDLLPTEHKERSNMGRKISALLEKSDKMEIIMARQQEMIELLAGSKDIDDEEDAPLTIKEFTKLMNTKKTTDSQYENDFKSAFNTLSKDLDDDVQTAVGAIMFKKFNVNETGNGSIDGATNFHKAHRYYEKAMKRKIPLKKEKAQGVITSQKTTKTTKTIEKLDKQSEKYLEYVTKTRGAEAADRLRKSL